MPVSVSHRNQEAEISVSPSPLMARITCHATLPRISQTLNGNVSARESSSLVLSRANELLKRWRMPACSEKPNEPTGQAGGIEN